MSTPVAESTCTYTCSDIEELLPLIAEALIDNESDPLVFDHLSACAQCADSLVLQDLITLSLGADVDMQQDTRRDTPVIYFQIPTSILSAAALLLGTCAAFAWFHSTQPQQRTDIITATAAHPDTEILRVIPAQNGKNNAQILIRHHGQTLLIPQDRIDSGTRNQEIHAAIPVVVRSP